MLKVTTAVALVGLYVCGDDVMEELTSLERELLRRCRNQEGMAVCSDKEMRVDVVTGCEGGEAGTATFCDARVTPPPPLTIFGRGFGPSGHTVLIGESQCEAVSANTYAIWDDTFYYRLICSGYVMPSGFSALVTVIDSNGVNVTGPSAVHFGPPIVTGVSFNDTSACTYDDDTGEHITCTTTPVAITFTGRHFPTQGYDYPSSFLAADDYAVQWGTSERIGAPCTNILAFRGSDYKNYLKCDLYFPPPGSPRLGSVPGVYTPTIMWGSLVGAGNVTLTIPPYYGEFLSISCGDYTWPQYPGPYSTLPGPHRLTMAADASQITDTPVQCTTADVRMRHACCTIGGGAVNGDTAGGCNNYMTWEAANTMCNTRGYKLCTKGEIEKGFGSQTYTACNDYTGRRVWVSNENACTNEGSCVFETYMHVQGTWYAETPEDYDIRLFAIDETGFPVTENSSLGNWTCAVRDIGYRDGAQTIKCEPLGLWQSGKYGVTLAVGGVTFPVEAKLTWILKPEINAVTGCYDFGRATTRCPTNGETLLTIHGYNLHTVTHANVAGLPCDLNTTRDLQMTSFSRMYCNLTGYDMSGISSRIVVAINAAVFTSPPLVTVSFLERPVLHDAFCSLPGGLCPSQDGPITITGRGFDTLVTPYTRRRLLISGIECDRFLVVNTSHAFCDLYDLKERVPELYHTSNPELQLSLIIGEEVSRINTYVTFRRVPYVTAVEGCPAEGCRVRGEQLLTVIGGNFSSTDTIHVHINGERCGTQTYLDEGRLLCGDYPRSTTMQSPVTIEMNGEWSTERVLLFFRPMCGKPGEKGCSGHGVCTHAAECICMSSQITGHWDGVDCERCKEGYFGLDCVQPCLCPSEGICDYGMNGTGHCTSCATNFTGSLCTPCPGLLVVGEPCYGHGICNDTVFGDGTCTCVSEGWDAMRDCDVCSADYYGLQCEHRCPGGAACSGNGRCDAGFLGTGKCSCDVGWGGTACEIMCPGMPDTVCDGHGECGTNGRCTCYSGPDSGYWAGTDCSSCGLGWSGGSCLSVCAVDSDGRECFGHGSCGDSGCSCIGGYCGSDCRRTTMECALAVCPSAENWGNPATCSAGVCGCFCPTNLDLVCSGHGSCDSGEYGSGRCICNPGRAGVACEHDCSTCYAADGGVCNVDGVCVCKVGYSSQYCEQSCPGANIGNPCGGINRGICSDGHTGTGLCSCLPGYAGDGCTIECFGGAANPCSGHGTCSPTDGSCTCEASRLGGYWDGVVCDRCQTPFFLPLCNETCPGHAPGFSYTCSGHGFCEASTGSCLCDNGGATGSWGGTACEECTVGYFGLNCDQECPGGACNPCSGHGTCSDGIHGTGTCSCLFDNIFGYWVGARCDECAPNYYERDCILPCSGLNTPEGICHGRGICKEGRTGDGQCVCLVPGQAWMGADCNECQVGFYGSLCDKSCPSTNEYACSGNGICSDGKIGFGNCTCSEGWVGATCGSPCPGLNTAEGICNTHGMCEWDIATQAPVCVCHSDSMNGHWDSVTSCQTCMVGYWGPGCTSPCPGSGNGVPCSGRGVVSTCDVVTGTCTCQSGWAGAGCDIECSGGAVAPCSLHGTCDQVTGRCQCHASREQGYWTGVDCSTCLPQYTSVETGCSYKCPEAATCVGCGPQTCSGFGQCVPALNGSAVAVCITCSSSAEVRCGTACDLVGRSNCQQYMCSGPRWGQQCQNWCPGASAGHLVPCSNHGLCDQGKAGSGKCICDTGYVGTMCELKCPDCVLGQGSCNNQGTCTCLPGFASALCDVECPGSFRSPCGAYNSTLLKYELHGVCNDGATGDGKCTCDTGWRGSDCNTRCDGILPNGIPCNGNGICLQYDPLCACSQGLPGYWANDATGSCTVCASGWVGENCTQPCINGATKGKECICHQGYYGPMCDAECLGYTVYARRIRHCNANGVCSDGNTGTGQCTCDPDYFGEACQTYCKVEIHCQQYRRDAVNCGANRCECIRNSTHGYWGGDLCERCEAGFWGSKCLQHCSCSGNMYMCNQLTGACSCYADPVNGYFAGTSCDRCKAGYIGISCQSVDVGITRSGSALSAPASISYKDTGTAITIYDPLVNWVMVTSTPIAVFVLSGGALQYSKTYSASVDFNKKIIGSELKSSTVDLIAEGGFGGVELLVLWRANLTIKSTLQLFAASREHAVLSRYAQLQSVPVLKETLAVGDLWCFIYETVDSLELRFAKNTILHTQSLQAYNTFVFAYSDGAYIAVAGALDGQHGLTAMLTDSTTGAIVSVVDWKDTPGLSQLHGDISYESFFATGDWWYVAVRDRDYLKLVRVNKLELFKVPPVTMVDCAMSNNCTDVMQTTGTWKVTKLQVELGSGSGYVSVVPIVDGKEEPAWMYRFSTSPLRVTGSLQFTYYAGQAEAVHDFTISNSSHALYALSSSLSNVRLVTLNTYYVEAVVPNVADARGGTPVTVLGKGFPTLSGGELPLCRVGTQQMEVLRYNATSVVCMTVNHSNAGCSGSPVDVSFAGPERYTSNNNAKLRRVFSATPVAAVPAKGLTTGGAVVTVSGYGFDFGGYLMCSFYDDTHHTTVPAVYLSSNLATCVQPAWFRSSTKGSSFLKLSQDGSLESVRKVPYEVVGSITELRVTKNGTEDTYIKLPSMSVSTFPLLDIKSIDASKHAIYPLMQEELHVTVSHRVNCITSVVVNQQSIVTTLNYHGAVKLHGISGMPYVSLGKGQAVLGGLHLQRPKAAICELTFEVYSALPGLARSEGPRIRQKYKFEVTAGSGSVLRIIKEPDRIVNPARQLAAPVVELLDNADNPVAPSVTMVLQAEVISNQAEKEFNDSNVGQKWIFRPDSFTNLFVCSCERITMAHALYGVEYSIEFSMPSSPEVAPVVTSPLVRANCLPGEYAVLFTPDCKPCPVGGMCDGTWTIRVSKGHWRWPLTDVPALLDIANADQRAVVYDHYTTFYKCWPSSACTGPSDVTEAPQCRVGHLNTSILCMDCQSGYGFSGDICQKCNPLWLDIILFFLICLAVVVVVGGVMYTTYIDNVKGVKSVGFIQMKQVLSWLQMVAASSDGKTQWPSGMSGFYSLIKKVFSLHTGIGPISCLFDSNYYDIWLFMMLLPVVVTVLLWVGGVAVQLYQALKTKEEDDVKSSLTFDTDITFLLEDSEKESDGGHVPALITDIVGYLIPNTALSKKEEERKTEMMSKRKSQMANLARGFVMPNFPDLFRGTESQLLVALVTKAPPTDVTLIPTGAGLTFVPPVFAFTSETSEVHFSVVGHILGEHDVIFRVTGTDRRYYPAPEPSTVIIFDEWKTGLHDKVSCSLIVFFFFMYPLMLSIMAGLFPCSQIGPHGDYYLKADPRVQCYTTRWWSYVVGNIVCFCVYCLAIPGACIYYMYLNSWCLEHTSVRTKVGFLFRGLKPDYWYWEFVVMTRKLLVVIIGTFTSSLWNKIYIVQWVIGFFLFLNLVLHPFIAEANHSTETLILTSQVITMNIALIYFTDGLAEHVNLMAKLALITVNLLTVLALVLCYFWIWKTLFVLQGKHRRFQTALLGAFDEDGDGDVTFMEIFAVMKNNIIDTWCALMGKKKNKTREWLKGVESQQKVGLASLAAAASVLPYRQQYFVERTMQGTKDISDHILNPLEMELTTEQWLDMKQQTAAQPVVTLPDVEEEGAEETNDVPQDNEVVPPLSVEPPPTPTFSRSRPNPAANYIRMLEGPENVPKSRLRKSLSIQSFMRRGSQRSTPEGTPRSARDREGSAEVSISPPQSPAVSTKGLM